MEYKIKDNTHVQNEKSNFTINDSSEDFQKFIYKLFEKNGVLSDLRAYLRGQIVNVLNNVNTGEPLSCNKNFTQRLDHKFQALNIIIAEYLMKMDFCYSFSVFISEVPLANMVFDFSRLLFNKTDTDKDLQFSERDIWRILHYLGIKCDSEHATKILDTYQKGDQPLFMCLLACVPLYVEPEPFDEDSISVGSLSSNSSSSGGKSSKRYSHNCKHYAHCKTCGNRIFRLKEKYKRKKMQFSENAMKPCSHVCNVENFARNVKTVEETLVTELFDQLKNVYEGEIDLVRDAEQKKVKRSLASHALLLRKHRDELEQEMKERRDHLEAEIQKKKEFVWGLASTLRDTHARLAQADGLVKEEAARIQRREKLLKIQLEKAEELLKVKGEEMREQISGELSTLDKHLETMKKERDDIERERKHLEDLRQLSDTNIKMHHNCKEDLMKEYMYMKNELASLKNYIERSGDKCPGQLETKVMNNEHGGDKADDDRVKQNQVINDLKKQKNINLSQTNIEVYRNNSRGQLSAVGGTNCDNSCDVVLRQLQEENGRLKEVTKQQSSHIELLSLGVRHVHAPTTRPRTAPALPKTYNAHSSVVSAVTAVPRGQGGGEELCTYVVGHATVRVPGDEVPFIGVLRDRRSDNRRYYAPRKETKEGIAQDNESTAQGNAEATCVPSGANPDKDLSHPTDANQIDNDNSSVGKHGNEDNETGGRSTSAIRREIKEKVRKKYKERSSSGERSPNKVLREAKLRLRKLEIEAEAVEMSYKNFRQRRAEENRQLYITDAPLDTDSTAPNIDRTASTTIRDENIKERQPMPITKGDVQLKRDFNKYLREYARTDINYMFKNRNTAIEKSKPIPEAYSEIEGKKPCNFNYLETPLIEFRKFYQTGKYGLFNDTPNSSSTPDKFEDLNKGNINIEKGARELKILQNNIKKIYNIESQETHADASKDNDSQFRENEINDFSKLKDDMSNEEIEGLLNEDETTNIEKIPEDENSIVKSTPRNEGANLLKVEIEHCEVISKTTNILDDVVIVMQTSFDSTKIEPQSEKCETSPPASTIVSPKATGIIEQEKLNSLSDSLKLLLNNPNDLNYNVKNVFSNQDSNLEISKENSLEGLDQNIDAEYPDDFSADVDNYNNPSDYGNNSPISVLKSSEDENFWDS